MIYYFSQIISSSHQKPVFEELHSLVGLVPTHSTLQLCSLQMLLHEHYIHIQLLSQL